jgi:hypothetical protein
MSGTSTVSPSAFPHSPQSLAKLTWVNAKTANTEENFGAWRGCAMTQYHVSFYKDLLSSYGTPFRCLQAEIQVDDALTSDEAAIKAECEFERLWQIPHWKIRADNFVVESEPGAPLPVAQWRRDFQVR